MPSRVALIGAGSMGSNHGRVLRAHPEAELTHVVDADAGKGRKLAEELGATYAARVTDVLGQVDAAVVAVPTQHHLEVGTELLRAGVHVLMEKPIAASVEEGAALIREAEAAGVRLMVGHVERFNPAVLDLQDMITEPLHVECKRLSAFSPRIADGVIKDLMIHDLDLVLGMVGGPVALVSAVSRRLRSQTEDHASALLRFESGTTATLTASRIGQQKIRQIEIIQPDNFVHVDLLRQDISIHRVEHSEFLPGGRYSQTGVVQIPLLRHRGEPLALEWSHFLECVRTGATPKVSGEDGLRALELAIRLTEAADVDAGALVEGA
jgi:predicted dehydrogenase